MDEEEEQIWNVVLGLCASTRWDRMVREPLPGIAGGGREGQVGDSIVWEGRVAEERSRGGQDALSMKGGVGRSGRTEYR
jgi:hypothetical protein